MDERPAPAPSPPRGVRKAEKYFNLENLTDPENMTISHHINQAIRAHGIMKRDIDYVVKDGEVIIVDEFTVRLMIERRYNEACTKPSRPRKGSPWPGVQNPLATITFQNYFRMYKKLAGMTGTRPHRGERVPGDL